MALYYNLTTVFQQFFANFINLFLKIIHRLRMTWAVTCDVLLAIIARGEKYMHFEYQNNLVFYHQSECPNLTTAGKSSSTMGKWFRSVFVRCTHIIIMVSVDLCTYSVIDLCHIANLAISTTVPTKPVRKRKPTEIHIRNCCKLAQTITNSVSNLHSYLYRLEISI